MESLMEDAKAWSLLLYSTESKGLAPSGTCTSEARIKSKQGVYVLCPSGDWNFFKNRQVIQAMNFTPEQMKPLQNCNLVKLKERLQAKEENGDETPAKMIKLDEDAIPQIEMGSLDGLVIACRRPSTIAKELIKLLAPSGSFVIYCPYSEVNLQIFVYFQKWRN